ncbi:MULTISPECIES: metallophosphoesterase family protein [unclassified Caballeronia]|uniref:metallophosphoesterase family protein n=1 Tax=unclassified Caballeronia TaxID=2646786 RepID=UPI0028662B2D|nr:MULTISPECIES: metallophosphoesterase family protein [unclassified Caballeronia]MDR5739707.1 metallophosphoesterase family protein [Caballeronia sp. LZ016]MDR5808173.1 metallophosphoesterase family protein [Caballeronia sp. LZ019]
MTLLLQISDPHFGTEQPRVVAALSRLIEETPPDLVIVSGDITQRARKRQFAAARAFFDTLGATPTLVVPGNHDIPLFNVFARLFQPYANHQRAFGAELEPSFESPDVIVLGVNTTRPYRHKDGEVSMQQVKRVAARLESAKARQLRIVVTHQPVAVTRAKDEANLLHGRERAVPRWARAGADLIVGGHIHLPYVLPLHDTFANLPRRMWAVQAGTALSSRTRGSIGNSVNVIRYSHDASDTGDAGARRVVVERWDYAESDDRFEQRARHELALDGAARAAAVTSAG